MKLLDLYIEKNNDVEWFEKHYSTGKKGYGKIFGYTTTNFRTQDSFIDQFSKFEKVEGISTKNWPQQSKHGQKVDKQRTANMLAAKLFKKQEDKEGENKKEFLYYKTKKGELYKKFIEESNVFTDDDIWLLNYVFLLTGHYSNTKNHIYEKVKFLSNRFIENIDLINLEKLHNLLIESISSDNREKLLKTDGLYLMSFYTSWEFLEIYFNSSEKEKNELKDYVLNNLQENNDKCVLSKKFKNSGNYSFTTAKDEFLVFNKTLLLMNKESKDVNLAIENFLTKNIIDFIDRHDKEEEIIKNIFLDFFSIEEIIEETPVSFIFEEETMPQAYIDDTTKIGKKEANSIFTAKKKQVKILSNYKCDLEYLNNCKYFTSKATKENYLEVHHIIPKEFRNEFENSIEVFANYASLCPHCHSLLHKGVDREKIQSLNFLFNNREQRLHALNLNIDLEKLYEFYKIDSDNK